MAIHQEELEYRIFTTGKNHPETGVLIPDKGTIPLAQTKSGTFLSDDKVVRGFSSSFESEFDRNRYLYSASHSVIRRIDYITDDNLMFLTASFPSNLASTNLVQTPNHRSKYKLVIVRNTGTVDAIVQEQLLAPGKIIVKEFDFGVAPISYDASAAGAELTFEVSK